MPRPLRQLNTLSLFGKVALALGVFVAGVVGGTAGVLSTQQRSAQAQVEAAAPEPTPAKVRSVQHRQPAVDADSGYSDGFSTSSTQAASRREQSRKRDKQREPKAAEDRDLDEQPTAEAVDSDSQFDEQSPASGGTGNTAPSDDDTEVDDATPQEQPDITTGDGDTDGETTDQGTPDDGETAGEPAEPPAGGSGSGDTGETGDGETGDTGGTSAAPGTSDDTTGDATAVSGDV
jgi:hypothetical protein